MPRRKKILGKDAVCACYGRFLRPSLHVRTRYPNMNKTKRFVGLVAVRLETRKIRNVDSECVILTSNEFVDDDGVFIEMYCHKRYIVVEVEGPSYSYFGHETINNDEEMSNDEPIELDEDFYDFINRTTTIQADDEDIQHLQQGEVEVDNDNDPLPENVPGFQPRGNPECSYKEWGHSGICQRKINGAIESKATLNFPSSFSPTLVDIFNLLFPKKFVEDVILVQTNKELKLGALTYGEFLRWLGLWFLMATIQGPERSEFWKLAEVDVHDGAPFRLNSLMTKNRFDEILHSLTLTDIPPPDYKDRFHQVRQIIDEWNKNTNENFKPGWVTCLDESMSTWTNKYTCPGFMFVPRKPWPFGNEYHSICCGVSGIMFGIEIVEGKDEPPERDMKEFQVLGKTIGLLLRLTRPMWGTAKMVVLDSGFCVLQGIIELKKRGVFAASLIKKRKWWPKHVEGEVIRQHFDDKQVGDVDAVEGTYDEQTFHLYSMKEPEYIMSMMTTYGTLERQGKINKRRLRHNQIVTFQYPEVIANHFKYRHIVDDHNARRHSPISLEVVWATKEWEKRVFAFLLAITEVNVMMAATYFYNKKKISMIQFLKEFSKELIYNNAIMNEREIEENRVLRSTKSKSHELLRLPINRKFKGSRMIRSNMTYGQYKCFGCKKKIRTYCKCTPGQFFCADHYADHIVECNN